MLKRWLGVVAAGILLAGLVSARAEVAVPPLKARVTDLTGTLTGSQIQALDARLRDFERDKGSQITVLILPSTQPETIEQYSIRVADAKRVVSEVIAPHFGTGDFYGGIAAGTGALMKLIEGEGLPAPPSGVVIKGVHHAIDFQTIFLLFIVLVLTDAIFRRLFGRVIGAGISGGIVGAIVWVAAGALAFAVIGGLIGFVIALVNGLGNRRGGWSSGGWPGGGFGGGGFGGGGFGGGGGFSGGGGGFSGGGASGSW